MMMSIHGCILYMCFSTIFSGVSSLRFRNYDEIKHRGTTNVTLRNVQYDAGKLHGHLPASLTMYVTLDGKEVVLRLVRNTDIRLSSIQTLSTTGHHEHSDLVMNIGNYQDVSNRATVELECLDVGCRKYVVFASLFIGDEHIIFQKHAEEDTTHPASSYEVLHKSTSSIKYGVDYMIPDKLQVSTFNQRNSIHNSTIQKRATGTYTVELLLVIDYSVYKFWYDKATETSTSARRTAAINDIKRYYAHVINGIDLRYSVLTGGSFTIDIIVTGIYIAESQADAPYSQTTSGTLDAPNTLNAFSSWVNAQTNLPKSDYALMFTKLDLTRDGSNSNKGYAFTGGMCSPNSQGIVEEDFGFNVETTAAHELGHGLNAIHDDDTNTCSGSLGYIMAATTQVFPPSDNRRRNTWEFSSCSVTQFNSFIDGLSQNCLLTRESTATSDLNSYTATPIGQSLPPDMQCTYKYGTGSALGRSFYNASTLSNICTSMYCSDPSTPGYYLLMVPGFGTSCGNNKWCESGRCVLSNQAPSLTESCPFGDEPGNAVNNVACSTYIQSNPSTCYGESTYGTCCSSCNAQRTGITGCEFGDKASGCTGFTSGSSCYIGNNADLCCGTCKKFETGIADCAYGDRADCTSVGWSSCYVNVQTCCLHCAKYRTGIPGCMFGDRVSGCTLASCSSNADLCCQTCYNGTTTMSTTTPTSTAAPTTTPRRTTPTTQTTTPTPSRQWTTTVVFVSVGVGILIIIAVWILCCYVRNRNINTQKDNPYLKSQSYRAHQSSAKNIPRGKPFVVTGHTNPAFHPV